VSVFPTSAAEALRSRLAGCGKQVMDRFGRLLGRRLDVLTAGVFDAAVVMGARAGGP
jgi:hypothetical protein